MPSAALLFCGLLGAHAARIRVHSSSRETVRDEYNCGRVKGATISSSGWKCQCPEQQVVTGENVACRILENQYSRYFNLTDYMGDACKCAHKPGCGLVKYAVEDVIPANAAAKGLPPPMEVGTRDNINTGIPELDAEYYGLWWMKDNPVPEELASMAGAVSGYTGKNLSPKEAKWPVAVSVPNARKHRWAWADTKVANYVIMPQYYGADGMATFNMSSTTKGKIPTSMEKYPFGVNEWGLDKINDNTWLRETTFKKVGGWNPIFSDTNYTLTRILFEDGTVTEHFKAFEKHMKTLLPKVSQPLQVWDSDDTCKRKCMHSTHDCHHCHECCTGGNGGKPKWNCRFGYR